MHVYFSGIGGAGIGPLSLIAKQAGFTVSGSDKQHSSYIDNLKSHGVEDVHIGQSYQAIAEVHSRSPIEWFVYSSALPMEQPDAPELKFCREHGIMATKRDEFLNHIIEDKNLKLIAVAGTHGKTTTTAMAIWLFKQLGSPVSYTVGAKLSFGDMGEFNPSSQYFVYEADEFDRNFLSFHPQLSLITGIDWDHPDIYPTVDDYNNAFRTFIAQSKKITMWDSDLQRLHMAASHGQQVLKDNDPDINHLLHLPGQVNRRNAWQVACSLQPLLDQPLQVLITHLNLFPGIGRRFEQLATNIYTDYAHTPPKIRGALQLAHETAGDNVVVVYEGLHNTRQHFIKPELASLFDHVKQLYIVPTYQAREDPDLQIMSPEQLKSGLSQTSQLHTQAAELNTDLLEKIRGHATSGDLVLCLSAGGGHSLDEWLRTQILQEGSSEESHQ